MVLWLCDEDDRGAHRLVRRMLDVNIPEKRRRGRPNLRWKDACKSDMTQAGLREFGLAVFIREKHRKPRGHRVASASVY